jgi:hypothetical protein
MPNCSNCGSTLRRENGLLKCPACGVFYKPGQSTPLLSKYASKAPTNLKSQGDLDLETFINRLTQKLLPIYKDYPEKVKKVSYDNREKIKANFLKVTEGSMTFKKWFDWIHTNLSKHPVDLARIMLECCEGLNSAELKEFKAGCEQFYQYTAQMYNAGSPVG